MHVERFAPSPNGRLHLGHAFSALTAWDAARAAAGRFLLRIEDVDIARARPEHDAAIRDDLAWLGLSWEAPVLRQSTRFGAYGAALADLEARGLLYPCDCTRADIAAALDAPQEGDAPAPYPGTCRARPAADVRNSGRPVALRLDMAAALAAAGSLGFRELDAGPGGETGGIAIPPEMLAAHGDVVLARKDFPASYHLAVVLDDALQGITHVTRGRDLFAATAIHVLLQRLFGLPTPLYRHHRLIRNDEGRRLAKREADRPLAVFRAEGASPADIREMVGLTPA